MASNTSKSQFQVGAKSSSIFNISNFVRVLSNKTLSNVSSFETQSFALYCKPSSYVSKTLNFANIPKSPNPIGSAKNRVSDKPGFGAVPSLVDETLVSDAEFDSAKSKNIVLRSSLGPNTLNGLMGEFVMTNSLFSSIYEMENNLMELDKFPIFTGKTLISGSSDVSMTTNVSNDGFDCIGINRKEIMLAPHANCEPSQMICYPSSRFMSFCYSCKKALDQNKDIYIYRGDKAFCSEECREQEIFLDESILKKCINYSSDSSQEQSSYPKNVFVIDVDHGGV